MRHVQLYSHDIGGRGMNPSQFDFDPSRALPMVSFRDPLWLAAEKDSIWHGDWVFVTTEDALPSPGDQIPTTVGDQPVLVLRNQEGELAAMSNLCAHRGTLLVEERVNARHIQCPYHAWTYDDAGRLIGVPFAPKDSIDKMEHCLPVYRVESWHGLVFVSLDTDVESLADRFEVIEPYVSEYGIDLLQHHSDQQKTEIWECNWKIAIINAMESYHLFKVHPKTLEPYTPTKGAYYVIGSARATATGGTVKGDNDYLLISLPPGFVGVLTSDSFVWQSVSPIDTHQCTIRTGGAFAASGYDSILGKFDDWFGTSESYASMDFLHEDKAICERIQRGATGDFAPGQLVPLERVVEDFGHYLKWQLNNIEPPEVYSAPDNQKRSSR